MFTVKFLTTGFTKGYETKEKVHLILQTPISIDELDVTE